MLSRFVASVLSVALVAGMAPSGATAQPASAVRQHAPGEEVIDARRVDAKTFATDDPATFETRLYTEPIHYRDGLGNWRDIDARLVPTGGGRFAAAANAVGASVAADQRSQHLGRLEVDSASVAYALEGARPGRAAPDPKAPTSIRYPGILAATDLRLISTSTGLKQELILHSRQASDTFVFPLALEGVTASLDEATGAVEYRDAAGDVVMVTPAGWMEDSSDVDRTGPATSDGVSYRLVERAGTTALEVTLDRTWLDDPARVYPVVVDPTLTSDSRNGDPYFYGDTYVQENLPSTNYSTYTYLRTGANATTKWRAFLEFGKPVSADGTHTINWSYLHLYNYTSAATTCTTGTGKDVQVKRVTSKWSASTAIWPGPSFNATSYASSNASYSTSNASCPGGWINFDITTLAREWNAGTYPNYGMAVVASHSWTDTYRAFYSKEYSDTTRRPYMRVNWTNNYPNSPTSPSPASGSVHAVQDVTLSGVYSDPDGDWGSTVFDVERLDGTSWTRIHTSLKGAVTSYGNSSKKLVGLTDARYRWRVRNYDGYHYSGYVPSSTTWYEFTVDAVGPNAPAISSTSHPNNTVTYADNSPTFTWSAADVSGINGYSWVLDQSSTTIPDTVSEGTGTSLSRTGLKDGSWWLHVRARNSAGVWGTTARYRINIGAKLAAPGDSEVLQGDVTVRIVRPRADATTVEFQAYSGTSWRTVATGTNSSGTWTGTWNTAATSSTGVRVYPNGPYRLRAKMTDSTGRATYVTGPTVTVDDNRLGTAPWWSFEDVHGVGQVNVGTGNVVATATDVALPTAAGEIAFSRAYNSQASQDGPLGWNWQLALPVDDEDPAFIDLERITAPDVDFVAVTDVTGTELYFLAETVGTTTSWTPAPGAEGLTLTAPAATGQPWQLTDLDGTVYRFGPASDGPRQLLASVTRPSANGAGAPLAAYGYTSGRLTTVTDPTGHKTFALDYDTAGRLTRIRAPFDGDQTLVTFGYQDGHLTTVTDTRTGLVTRYGYDPAGKLLTGVTPAGLAPVTLGYLKTAGSPNRLARTDRAIGSTVASATYGYTFAADGTSTTTVRPPKGVAAGNATFDWTYRFDSSSRPTAVTSPDGLTRTTVWDARNNIVSDQTAAEAAAAAAAKAAGGSGEEFRTTRVYAGDAGAPANCSPSTDGTDLCVLTGPEQQIRRSDGSLTTTRPRTEFRYDEGLGGVYHLVTTRIDPDGTITIHGYDADGLAAREPNRITVTAPDGTVVSTRSYRYDAYGRVTAEVAPKGHLAGADATEHTTTFAYHPDSDAVQGGYLAKVTKPAGQSPALVPTAFTYNVWGQAVTSTDGAGTTSYGYDTAQRPVTVTAPGDPTVTTAYDPATSLLSTVTDTSGTIAHAYDTWGRTVRQTDATGEPTTFTYDLHSNQSTVTDRHGTVTHTHDTLDRITVLDDPAGTFHYSYAPDQTLKTVTLPNGIVGEHTSRPATGDLDTLVYRHGVIELGRFDRDYDASGRVIRDLRPASVREYSYDRLGRLVKAVDRDPTTNAVSQTRGYSYDANTNRTRKTVTGATGALTSDETYTYDNADRLLTVAGGPNPGSFTYDHSGNTVTMPARALTWTGAHRLATATALSGETVDYTLDPLGRTLSRAVRGSDGVEATRSVHHYGNGSDSPTWTEDTNAGATSITRNVTGPAGLVATHQVEVGTRFPLSAPHGDTWAVANTAGTITTTSAYDEFGLPLTGGSGDRYGWLGKHQRETDPATDLVLMGVRAYDPTLGRFLSIDPVHGGSANDYDYCNADPLNCYDLDGRAAQPKKLSSTERAALEKQKQGKPLTAKDRKLINSAKQKMKHNEKIAGSRNRQKRQSNYIVVGRGAFAAAAGAGAALLLGGGPARLRL